MKKSFLVMVMSVFMTSVAHSVNPYETWNDMDFRSTYEPIDWSAMNRFRYEDDYRYRSQSSNYDNNITNRKRVSAEIEKVWVDYNDFDSNGNSGMKIHVKFTVRGMLNEQGSCALYFYDENGNALEDANDSYCTSKGTVATQKNFKPSYENSVYKDFKIFMPYSELHLKATTSCYFRVIIWSGSEELVRSGKYSFNYVVN